MPPPVNAIVLPSEVIGKAIEFITEHAWCQGQEPKEPLGGGQLWRARNVRGEPVALLNASGDAVNPDVHAVTAYAAIAQVLADRNCWLQDPAILWDTVSTMAIEATPDIAVGGENYLHPIHNLNEKPGQTQGQVVAFLTSVQMRLKELEKPKQSEPVIEQQPAPIHLKQERPIQVEVVNQSPVSPPPVKQPPGKGSPRPQPTPTPKPNLPPPKVKSPVKKVQKAQGKRGR